MSALGIRFLRRLPSVSRETLLFACVAWGVSCLFGILLTFLPAWQTVERKVFDWMTILSAPGRSQLPITIVGIDEASFTQLGLQWPWPRSLHAQLVDRLNEAGAAVVAFDLLFSEPSAPKEDDAFAAAIARANNVVLAADYGYHETASIRQWLRLDPVPALTRAGAATGLATMELDGDAVARRFSNAPTAFWRQVIETFMKARPGAIDRPYVPPDALMRFLGPAHTFPYVSYYQVLQGFPDYPPDFFADQIVLVGRDIRTTTEALGTQGDTFATPFLTQTRLMTPGVEIHATQVENALMGQVLRAASTGENLLLLLGVLIAVAPALLFWNPWRSSLVALLAILAMAGGSYGVFVQHRLWFAAASPALCVVLSVILMTGLSYYAEQRRTRRIRSAFSLYVSPEVVAQMITQPDRLRLGGERKELSLLFCDLAGFTSMSERLTPDGVANVINCYLDEMTGIIMKTGGTVDKFIGDAIMAFWGAPLEDEAHTLHAVQAAIKMQARMHALQPEFVRLGAGPLKLRIGIHSGEAIVGNMGSTQRFDYTALGDSVNLASRLEGINKAYGTYILLSSATRAALPEPISLRRVDRVRVKGKDIPVDIFTPCEDGSLIEATEQAWAAYAACRWDDALRSWSWIRQSYPDDSLAGVFMPRIEAFRATPPHEGWDASVALEKY